MYSVWQTDIILYGANLQDYLEHEFRADANSGYNWNAPETVREIPFGNDIVYGRGFDE